MTTMDFLRSYSSGVIVLMPVLFLVVIPYLSSKLLKATDRAIGYLRVSEKEHSDLQVIADERSEPDSPVPEDATVSDDYESTEVHPASGEEMNDVSD